MANDVVVIRELAATMTVINIARRYGVDPKTIKAAIQRKTWRHVK